MKEWRRKERVRKRATKSNNTQRRQSLGDMESLGDCLLVYYLIELKTVSSILLAHAQLVVD